MTTTGLCEIIQQSPLGIAYHEILNNDHSNQPDYKFVEVNSSFEKMLGMTQLISSGLTVNNLCATHNKLDPGWCNLYSRIDLKQVTSEYEQYFCDSDKWYTVQVHSGEQFFSTIFIDITNQKKAESSLRKIEKDLRKSQRIARLGSWHLDLESNQVEWTEELYAMYGFDPKLPPPPFTEHMNLFTPVSWNKLYNAIENTKNTGEPYTLELETVKSDGKNGWMWVHGEVEIDKDGILRGLWGAAQDITIQKQAADKLKDNETLLNNSQKIAHLGSWRYDLISKRVERSDELYRILGCTSLEYDNSCDMMLGFIHPDDVDRVKETYRNSIREHRSGYEIEHRIIRKNDGEIRYVINTCVHELDETRTVIRSVGTLQDITKLKNDAEELRLLNEDLLFLNAITNVANQSKDFNEIAVMVVNHLRANFSSDPVSVSIPTPQTGEQETAVNFMKTELIHKIKNFVSGHVPPNTPYKRVSTKSIIERDLGRLQLIADHLTSVIAQFESEKKRKEVEARMYNAFTYSSIGMVIVSTDGKIQSVNPAMTTILGYTGEEFLQKTARDISHPDDLIKDISHIQSMLEGKTTNYQTEKRYLHKSGKIIWAILSMSLVRDTTGRPLSFVSQVQDITERKLAEEHIKESERKYRRIFESVQDVYFEATIDGTLLEISPSIEKLVKGNYVKEEMIGNSFIDVFADPKQRELYFAKLIKQKSVSDFELLLINKDGSTLPVAISAVISFDSNGNPERITGILRDISERKQAEYVLRETLEELYQTNSTLEQRVEERTREILEVSGLQKAIFTNSPIAILTSNAQGIFQTINPAGEKMLGVTGAEIIGKHNPLLFHDDEEMKEFCKRSTGVDNPTEEEIFTTALQYMYHKTTEWTWVRKNGEKFPVRITHNTIYDANGVILGYMGLVSDITEEKKAVDSLRQREAENRAIIQAVPDLMFRIRRDGTYIDYHSHNNQSLYVPKEQFIGKTISETLPADLAILSKNNIEKAFATGEIVQFEYQLAINDKDCYFENRIIAISGSEVLSIIRDITLRKEAETALKMQSAAFESFALAIIITDINGVIQWTNPAFSLLTGYTSNEAIGKTSAELVKSGVHDSGFYKKLWNTILEKKIWSGELINRKKDGTLYHEEQTITPVLDSQGKINSFISIKIDITTRKLAQEELVKAKQEADKANQAKSMFLSRMSHELRTPMNSILGFAQLLEMGELDQKQRKGVTHILNNGKHLLDLINEVLDISGIESGKQTIITEPIVLSTLINEIKDNLQSIAAKKKISVYVDETNDEHTAAYADRIRVRQILINLIGNAIKYNIEGGSVVVQIQLLEIQNQKRIKLSVSDTGPGINPEDLSKLFQPFERIGADKTQTEGTGLGLMVVKRLTEAMGGTVGVESTVGKGSTFWLELPAYLGTDREENTITLTETKNRHRIGNDLVIVYIEDNQSNIELVENIIIEHCTGTRLITSTFGLQTTDLALKHNPALILLDLDLPDIQGGEVLRLLMNDDRTKSIPVVIVSADAMPRQIETLMNMGAKDYLSKPLDIARFLHVIDQYINT